MTRFNFFLNIGWVPCWFRLQTKATHAKPWCKRRLTEHGQRGFVLLASMLVSSFQGMGEVTMEKVPWGSMLGSMLVSSFQGMRVVTMGKVPWGPMLGSMLVSSFQGMRVVIMGKVPWGSMLASMLVSSFQGMGEVTMGKVPWGCMLASMLVSAFQDMDRVLQADLPVLGRSPRAGASPVGSTCKLTCFPCWVEVLEPLRLRLRWVNVEANLELGKCPRGFRARRPRSELPLLGRSPRASVSRWGKVESNLEPGKRPWGCGARRFWPELPLLGRSPRASVSLPLGQRRI